MVRCVALNDLRAVCDYAAVSSQFRIPSLTPSHAPKASHFSCLQNQPFRAIELPQRKLLTRRNVRTARALSEMGAVLDDDEYENFVAAARLSRRGIVR